MREVVRWTCESWKHLNSLTEQRRRCVLIGRWITATPYLDRPGRVALVATHLKHVLNEHMSQPQRAEHLLNFLQHMNYWGANHHLVQAMESCGELEIEVLE